MVFGAILTSAAKQSEITLSVWESDEKIEFYTICESKR